MRGVKFYVNGTTGSDVLDTGRGESASKPFKTIGACVKYVTDNYNISNYICTVNIASGTYQQLNTLTLGDFSRSSGYIVIKGNSRESCIISRSDGFAVKVSGGKYLIRDLTIDFSRENNTTVNAFPYGLSIENSDVTLQNIEIKWNISNNEFGTNIRAWLLHIDNSGNCTINNKIYITSNDIRTKYACDGIIVNGSGTVLFNGSNDSEYENLFGCEWNGNFSVVLYVSGKASVNTSFAYDAVMSGNVVGTRYYAVSGGQINTGGSGSEYFPGTKAGVVESSTYSWYK